MKTFFRSKKFYALLAVVIVIGAIYYFGFAKKGTGYQFITVKQGTITQTVSVTGNTTPVQSLDLAFQNGGTIASVNKNVGDSVAAGDVIVTLNTSGLQAQLAQAQAAVDAANAQLSLLQAGAQPTAIEASQAAVAAANQSLANTYANVGTTLLDAYAKANDAVRNQLSPFFSGAETSNPQLTFSLNNSQTANNLQSERVQASTELNAWQIELNSITSLSPTSTLETALTNGIAHLSVIQNLLETASNALIQQTSLSANTLANYKTAVASAITEEGGGSTEVSGTVQNIASQKIAVQQAQAQLNVTLAGSTTQAIQAQQAQVEEAQANEQNIQVEIREASLVSPINGVITVQNAKVGEIATPGATLVSIISSSNLEVDSYVPETDIGKVSVGNTVSMTFDAFPGETFSGKVFYIDPAETILQGVVDYKIKASFDKVDPRMKSGLTANLSIATKEDDNALILPQFAILQTDQGSFVEVLQNGAVAQMPVTTGIQDESGNVEVLTGVTNGEQVLNIGLK